MKKFLKILAISLVSIVLVIYCGFLIAPLCINLDKFKPEIQKLVLENSKLNLDYSKIKIYTTPLLSIGIIAQDVKITLDDNSSFFEAPKIKAGIALPPLLILSVKSAGCLVENPNVNLEIQDGKQYKIVKIVEDLINENNAKPKVESKPLPPVLQAMISAIRIKVPSIKIVNLNILVNDIKANHNLVLKAPELVLGYNSANSSAKIKTNAQILSDDKENINANIKIITSIPKTETVKQEVDPEEKIAIPFINIVEIYQNYDLNANIEGKIKIKETKDKNYLAHGFLNIDDLNLKLSDIRLPNSFLHAKFSGEKIQYETDIYAKDDEKLSLKGFFKYGNHPKLKSEIISEKISFSNLLDLFEGLLDSLNIKNNLAEIKATGYLSANATIKTNFKKLKSDGSITITDGSFVNPSSDIGIKDIALNLIFDNNVLNIKDSKAAINGSLLAIKGKIDNKSNADIKIDVDNLSLTALFNSFAPKELKKAYLLNSAVLSAHIDIAGKLDKLSAKLKTNLENLSLSDSKKTMFIKNKNVNIDLSATPEIISGEIKNTDFSFDFPSMNTYTKINDLNINITNDAITIVPFDFVYNENSKINIKGAITNYLKNPQIDIFASGAIEDTNLKQTLGSDVSYYLQSHGAIPVKASIKGDSKKQNIIAQIYCDSNNYISPINLDVLLNAPSLMNLNAMIHGNKIKLSNSGLFKKHTAGFNDDLDLNLQNTEKIAELAAAIDGSHINLLRLNIPQKLSGKIAIFPLSSFKTGGKITLNGTPEDINYGGDYKIEEIDIPEILFKLKSLDLNFVSNGVDLSAKEIDVNSSKIDSSLKANLKPAKIFKISDINVESQDIDVDKALAVMEKLTKYMPPQKPSSSAKTTAQADIPLNADGKFNISKIKSGDIIITDAKGVLGILNNEFLINNLSAKAFDGTIKGDIKMNLLSTLLTIKVNGKNINADKMLTQAAAMKDTISGTAKFDTDISLKGSTYLEQVKSLKGKVNFSLKDGQYGPFAKLENFFLAENIRENAVFKNTIGAILTPLTTINSTHFEELKGTVEFKNGSVIFNPITSRGDILCILITGNMNLVSNEIDSNVKVRLASAISDMLGPIALANPVNLIKNTPGLNIATAKLFSIFTTVVDESVYKQIPDFSSKHSDSNATKFQIVLNGDVAKPLKLVKSFKWLALQEDMDKADEFSKEYIQQQEDLAKQELINKLQSEYESENKLKVGVEKVLKMDTTAPAVKDLLINEILNTKSKTQEDIQEVSNSTEKANTEAKDSAIEI